MTGEYLKRVEEHRRITTLRVLHQAPEFRANDSILRQAVDGFGLSTSRDQMKVTLAWLAEQGLLALEDLGGVLVATLTERGADVATGRATVPGVQRPGPK